MALRIIRQEGDDILKKKSRPVEEIDDKIKELIKDMIETMHKYDGLGLAAPQIGLLKRIVVIDLYEPGTQYILINPEIISVKGEQEVQEGCLSFPNKYGFVIRPKEVRVKALNIDGEEIIVEGKDLLAQALCHEIDHLNGEVFIDKVEPNTLEVVTPERKNEIKKNRKK